MYTLVSDLVRQAPLIVDAAASASTVAPSESRNPVAAPSGESLVDTRFAQAGEVHDVEEHLLGCGVAFELTQRVGVDVADELLRAMEGTDAELLVIGVRRRDPVGKLLLGSVSQQVILECPKPVLAVKPAES